MNRRMLPAIFCAVAVLCSIPAAHAEVLVYEGFHSEDYSKVAADENVQANGHTATGNHTIDFSLFKSSKHGLKRCGGFRIGDMDVADYAKP